MDIFLTILQTSHVTVVLIPLFSALEGSMTQQRKLPLRPETVGEADKLNDALAILATHRRDAILEAVAKSAAGGLTWTHPVISTQSRPSA